MAIGFQLERDGWLFAALRPATPTDTKLHMHICYPVMELVTSPPIQALGTQKKQSDDDDDDVSPLQLKKLRREKNV